MRPALALLVRQDGQSLMVGMPLDLEELTAYWACERGEQGSTAVDDPGLRFHRTPYVIGSGSTRARVFWEAGLEATTGAGSWPPVRSFAVGESVPRILVEEVERIYQFAPPGNERNPMPGTGPYGERHAAD